MYRDAANPGVNDNITVFINASNSLTGALLLSDSANWLPNLFRPCNSAPFVTCSGTYNPANWHLYSYTIPAGTTWNTDSVFILIRATSQNGADMFIDDFSITTYPKSQQFISCTMSNQFTTKALINSANNPVVAIKVIIDGAGTGIVGSSYRVDSICFNVNGSTTPFIDIKKARLWWVGGTAVNLNPDTLNALQIPPAITPVTSTNIIFYPSASFRFENGENNFYLTYDIDDAPPATSMHVVDAEFIGMRIFNGASSYQNPVTGSLPGVRIIDEPYCNPHFFTGALCDFCFWNLDTMDYINRVILPGEAAYPPGIDNNLNSVGPPFPPCNGGPCPYLHCFLKDGEVFPPVTGKTAVVKAGGTYNLQVQVGSWYSLNCIAAWIDYNHDYDFDDAGEKIMQTPPAGLPAFGWQSANFTVPVNATNGATRLRVIEDWNEPNMVPCVFSCGYGEREDYVLNVIPDCSLMPWLAGWNIWLGSYSDDWNVAANWCGGVPNLSTNTIIVDSASSGGIIKPIYQPVVKTGVTALTKKLRITGNTMVLLNGRQSSSMTIADSLSIKDPASVFKVQSVNHDTIQLGNANLVNSFALIFGASLNKRRMWLTYTQAELSSRGLMTNDVIDTLVFLVKQRASTVPYNNLTISYYYTTPSACFPAAGSGVANPPLPVVAAGGALYSGSPDMSVAGPFFVPAAGGQLKIPLTTPLVWNGSANNLVIEICYDNPANNTNDQSYYTQTIGCRTFYTISQVGGTTPGCNLLNNTAGVLRFSSEFRPNITFRYHRNCNKFPIEVRGHWENNGTFTAANSIVTFKGTLLQNIDGTAPTTFHELEINNIQHVKQNTAVIVDDTLALTAGRFMLNQKTLTLNNGRAGALKRTSGYLLSEDVPPNYGKLHWLIGNNLGAHTIPFVNTGGNYIPFVYDLKSGTYDLNIGTYQTASNNTPLPTGVANINNAFTGTNNSANMADRFWIMDDNGTAPAADLTFNYAPSESPGAGPIRSQRYDFISGWQAFSSPQSNPAANQNLSQNISSFSTAWALTLQSQPLPVELLSFMAKPENSRVKLSWQTASENNTDYFSVDRSLNGNDYDFITQVKSQGTGTTLRNYFAYDEHPLTGIQYYRLKQVDLSGDFKYFGPVTVNFNRPFGIVTVIDKEDNSLTIVFSSESIGLYSYRIIDRTGRVIVSGSKHAAKGINYIELNSSLSQGIYTVIIQNEITIDTRKFFR